MLQTFSADNFHSICDKLAEADADLLSVIHTYGYPPTWGRPNTFETLVHIILEQQVSLASALSALHKLRDKVQEITPATILQLTDEEFKGCYFSRQKMTYVQHLAKALQDGQLDLNELELLSDEDVRARLIALKGIGNWTIDVYLIFVLRRADIYPIGDLAAVNALKSLKHLPKDVSREALLTVAADWGPYRSIATMLLWHYYLSSRVKSKTTKSPAIDPAGTKVAVNIP